MRDVGNTRAKAQYFHVSPDTMNLEPVGGLLQVSYFSVECLEKAAGAIGPTTKCRNQRGTSLTIAVRFCSASSPIARTGNTVLCESTHPTRRSEMPESNCPNLSPHLPLVLHSTSYLFHWSSCARLLPYKRKSSGRGPTSPGSLASPRSRRQGSPIPDITENTLHILQIL